jgi:hypothetical protein
VESIQSGEGRTVTTLCAREVVVESLLRKRASATGGEDAGQDLLAALALFALTVTTISVGTVVWVLARSMAAMSVVMPGRWH